MTTTVSSSNNNIRAIDRESVHRICSGQVVLDMATAVKELLENSLDAGATSIAIKFKQNGLESITVTDNGCGITDANLETLALKHYTSKLRSFNDLAHVTSFGFRGEALSSLCALSVLTVTTSTGASPTGVLVEYTSSGTIKSKTPTPMTKGTTVQISNLFEGMPVRRSEFVKNIKREYVKCIGLIQAYALIVPKVRISCALQIDKKPATTQIATSGNSSIRQNIINVFGPKAMTDVIDFELRLVEGKSGTSNGKDGVDDSTDENGDENEDEDELNQKGDIVLVGYISSPAFGKGRSSTDRQYIYINGRPCVLPKIARVINEVYRSFNTNQSPFLLANLILPTSYYDVNVSPDKRTIFLHNERMIVEELRAKLTELFEPSRSTFVVSEARQLIKEPDLSSRLSHESTEGSTSSKKPAELEEDELDSDNNEDTSVHTSKQNNRSSETLIETAKLSSLSLSRPASSKSTHTVTRLEQTTLLDRMQFVSGDKGIKRKADATDSDSEDQLTPDDDHIPEPFNSNTAKTNNDNIDLAVKEPNEATTTHSDISGHTVTLQDVMEGYDPLDDRTQGDSESSSDSEDEFVNGPKHQSSRLQRVVVLDSNVQYDGDREWIEVGFEMEEQRKRRAHRMASIQKSRRQEQERADAKKEQARAKLAASHQGNSNEEVCDQSESEEAQEQAGGLRRSHRLRSEKLSDASFANMDDAKAQRSLSRVISKDDFSRMKILGQFNKAFIVARLDKYTKIDESQDDMKETTESLDDPETPQRKRNVLVSSDIFVIDQHASDEKYNFETLQAKTVFSTQRLFQPKKLYLTAQEEITVVEHMKMLNKNGFYLDYDPDAPVSHRLKLVTLPVSEKVVFDLQDFEELVFLLSQQTALPAGDVNENPECEESRHSDKGHDHCKHGRQSSGAGPETMIRCSKVRALFASRACRRSVMIGHVLNHSQMKKIVRHMGEIDQPWNCPHGRPTMRHLLDLVELEQQEQRTRIGGSASQENGGGYDKTKRDDDMDSIPLSVDRMAAFDPVALKRPTRHQGSLFRQFMAAP
ncbi:Mismatch repair endonuclease pms2 [Entomortierella lignicola]|nr:Mismatch repair endonuclease pms2 [Entomortierella lignicola]